MPTTTASNNTKKPNKQGADMKLLLLGDSSVGKSCLLCRFTDDVFRTSLSTTIGIDFRIKTLNIDGRDYRVQIWDTAGQERFRTITTAFYRGAEGIMFVFDVTNIETFHNIKNWIGEIDQQHLSNVCKVIVGNKSDLVQKRVVTEKEARALAAKYKLEYFETSAKSGEGVQEAFTSLATNTKRKVLDGRSRKKRSSSGEDDEGEDDGERSNSHLRNLSSERVEGEEEEEGEGKTGCSC
ncbi:Ras- protein Rab-1A [Balamuthia mandrillaris]